MGIYREKLEDIFSLLLIDAKNQKNLLPQVVYLASKLYRLYSLHAAFFMGINRVKNLIATCQE